VLDKELASLLKTMREESDKESPDLASKMDALKARFGASVLLQDGTSQAKRKPSSSEILADRSSKHARTSDLPPVAGGQPDEQQTQQMFLRKLLSAMKGTGDGDEDLFNGDGEEPGLPRNLVTKRAALRQLAKRKPGLLLAKGLETFKEQLISSTGEGVEDEALSPCCLRYFLSVFLPMN
jgi:hypothetical protein